MGDPLSIVASAGGIISLGITVCQGLIDYCQAFAGQYRDVRILVQDLQGLERSLTFLRDSLTHRPDLLNHVQPYIAILRARVDDLQPVLGRFRENVSGQHAFKDKVKRATQRTLYPFKKGMVNELRDTVRQAQDNLSLALQVVQVHLLTHGPEGDISILVRQSAVAQTLLSAARQDMRQMESGSNGRLETVTLQLQKMPQKSRDMSDTTPVVRIPDPWATSDQGFEEVLPHVEKVGTAHSGERQMTLTESRRCNCAKILRRQTRSLWTSTWSFSWSESATSYHLKSCQYWNPYQEIWIRKLSVFHVNFLAAMALSASIQITKQAGNWCQISPSLTFRGCVNGSSPAFSLLRDLYELSVSEPMYSPDAISKLDKQTSLVTRSVRRLLKEGAVSPYDVDENGRTLLHKALSCYNMCILDKPPAFQELIHTLLDAGVTVNEVDLGGKTAFDYLISSTASYMFSKAVRNPVGELLANKGAEMSDIFLKAGAGNFQMSVEMHNVATLEPWQDATECGPLSLAVLQENEQDVARILRAKPSSIYELNRRKLSPLHLACCWPRGIQLLLDTGAKDLVHQVDVCGGLPITYSMVFRCLDAIELLINAGSAFSSPGWHGAETEEVLQVLYWEDPIPLFLLSTLQERRRKLFELAKLTLPAEVWADLDVPTDRLLDDRAAEIQRVLIDAGIEIPKSISVPQRRGTVYNGVIQSAKQADQLWDAGFRDIDSPNKHGYTPIMDTSGSTRWEYAQWLLNHGADLHGEVSYVQHMLYDKEKLVAGPTKLHYVAHRLGSGGSLILEPKVSPASPVVNEPLLVFEGLLVNSGRHDDCHCACSSGGCTPFTILLKTIRKEISFYVDPSSINAEDRRLLLQQLESPGHPASSGLIRSKIVEQVIWFETFEALQLSHTCCDFDYDVPLRRYTPEEVQEIHEEWEELLSKHEDLVSEFCHKFQELGGTLTSFLEGYWQTRMDEVLKEEKPYDEADIRRLRELGVVLEEAPEETKEKSEEDFDHEDLTDEDLTDGD